jgi:hypothetical protein
MTLGFSEPSKTHPDAQVAGLNESGFNALGRDSTDEPVCLNCSAHPIAYQSPGCKHPTLCKKCAMKQATGGKCKVSFPASGQAVKNDVGSDNPGNRGES